MNITNPFTAKIAAAEAHQAEQARLKQERRSKAVATPATVSRAPGLLDILETERLRAFGHDFLEVIANRVVKTTWSPEYIRQVQAYSEGLLRSHAVQLPSIGIHDIKDILNKFAYGLHLAELRKNPIPDGKFYGMQLIYVYDAWVTDRSGAKSSWTKPDDGKWVGVANLRIVPGDPRKDKPKPKVSSTGRPVPLAPAITHRGTRKVGRKTA